MYVLILRKHLDVNNRNIYASSTNLRRKKKKKPKAKIIFHHAPPFCNGQPLREYVNVYPPYTSVTEF
jgi:hypothetical protein